jgi:hypothetical protein
MSNMVPKTPHTVNTIRRVFADKPCVTTSAQPISPVVAAAKTPREAGIEWLRVIACVAIVAFHANTTQWPLSIFGLQVFTVFTIALAVQSAGRRGPGDFIRARASTLLLPWVFWWVAYAAWKTILCVRNDQAWHAWFDWWRLLAGPGTHLWFLPFAFVATAVAGLWFGSRPEPANIPAARRSVAVWSVLSAATLLASSYGMQVLIAELNQGRSYQPLQQWLAVLPAVMMGLGIVRSRVAGAYDNVSLLVLWVATMAAAGVAFALGWSNLAGPYMLAISLCMLGLRIRTPASSALLAASSLTFGIFLLHLMAFDVWYFLVARLHWEKVLANSHAFAASMTVFAVVSSAVVTWMLRKTALRRVL